jgi:hypothetical protein
MTSVPTLVAVYQLQPDDSTGSFLGFGSILDPGVVFLHPPRAEPPSIKAQLQPVSPSIAPGARVRCRISSDVEMTLDGTVLEPPADVTFSPTAIALDTTFTGDVDHLDIPQGPGHPTAEEAADAVLSFLQDVALDDPAEPTGPPPDTADLGGAHPHPGRRPWYCVICPGAFGC